MIKLVAQADSLQKAAALRSEGGGMTAGLGSPRLSSTGSQSAILTTSACRGSVRGGEPGVYFSVGPVNSAEDGKASRAIFTLRIYKVPLSAGGGGGLHTSSASAEPGVT